MNTTLEPDQTLEVPFISTPKTKADLIAEMLADERQKMQDRLRGLEILAAFMQRVPDCLIPKCREFNCGLEMNNLTRDEVIIATRELNGGKWTKKPNSYDALALDYETRIDGIRVRLWAAAPPGTCRIIEEKFTIPASETTVRRLICA